MSVGSTFILMIFLSGHGFFTTPAVYAELKLAVADVYGKERLERSYAPFADKLAAALNMPIRLVAIENRQQCLTFLQEEKLDLVLSGPAEFIVFSERQKVQPVIGFKRTDYYSLVVVRSDSGLRVPTDLRGKQIVFGDVGSTSSHLGAAQLLADHGLMPGKDYDFANVPYKEGVARLLQKDVAAIGMGSNQFPLLLQQYPHIPLHVIARGRDLPADLLLAAHSVDATTITALQRLFTEHGDTIRQSFQGVPGLEKYQHVQFIHVDDNEYNYVRAMYRTLNRPQIGVFIGD